MHPLAGQPAPADLLIDPSRLERDFFAKSPDPGDPTRLVSFGTSGHRGAPSEGTFNEGHILAISQAIAEYRLTQGIEGPLFMGKDTHAASRPAERTALEVFAANGVTVVIQSDDGFTPTPAISRAILAWNGGRTPGGRGKGTSDGVVITPSHNPPSDGGFKYNPPNGGPADTDVTSWIQDRANVLLADGNKDVKRLPWDKARKIRTTRAEDFVAGYVDDLHRVLNLEPVRSARLRIGVDPMGGAALGYWGRVAERYGLDLTITNPRIDSTFRFMPVDHDGRIRMDCSSASAMAGLLALRGQFDVAFGTDPDADRHGIVTRSAGLLNPNHYLAVAIHYLLDNRDRWSGSARIGKTLVSSAMIDRVVAGAGRELLEVPVGFKWFAPGLFDGSVCFAGEESAGATFLRREGTVWTTDKDGLLLGLLAAEMMAVTGKDPGEHYATLTARYGAPVYTRIDTPCTAEEKAGFSRLTADAVRATSLAGDPITAKLTHAPGNGAAIGGLKVTTANGWFAARPSGTESVYKVYAESFRDAAHLQRIVDEAREMLADVLGG